MIEPIPLCQTAPKGEGIARLPSRVLQLNDLHIRKSVTQVFGSDSVHNQCKYVT